jgi:hypothetical protein
MAIHADRAVKISTQDKGTYMTVEDMYCHLNLLQVENYQNCEHNKNAIQLD